MEEAPYPLMITYVSVLQHFNPVAYSTGINKGAYSSHFTVLLQSLIETKYERGKFSAYNIGSIQNPKMIIITYIVAYSRKQSLLLSLTHILPKSN